MFLFLPYSTLLFALLMGILPITIIVQEIESETKDQGQRPELDYQSVQRICILP